MKKNHLLVALVILAVLLLAGCSSEDAPIPAVPEGVQAGDLIDPKPCTYKAGETEFVHQATAVRLHSLEGRGNALEGMLPG